MGIDFARNIALNCLYKIDEENGYSNIVLDEYLNKYREKLNKKDINLISEIVYGTITWKLTIDSILQKYSKIKLKKMRIIAILVIIIIAAVLIFHSQNGRKQTKAMSVLDKYISYINETKYDEMYKMLSASSKNTITEEDFERLKELEVEVI